MHERTLRSGIHSRSRADCHKALDIHRNSLVYATATSVRATAITHFKANGSCASGIMGLGTAPGSRADPLEPFTNGCMCSRAGHGGDRGVLSTLECPQLRVSFRQVCGTESCRGNHSNEDGRPPPSLPLTDAKGLCRPDR